MLSANQIEFVNLIVDHLTEHGCIDAALLYTSSYTDISSLGVDGVFHASQVPELMNVLDEIKRRAVG